MFKFDKLWNMKTTFKQLFVYLEGNSLTSINIYKLHTIASKSKLKQVCAHCKLAMFNAHWSI